MKRKRFWIMALVLALVMALLPGGHTARADDPYIVNTTIDENDGSCSDDFDCSLRDAIILANTNAGPDTIEFNISMGGGNQCFFPSGVCRIQPTSALPALTDNDGTTIDGYTQPGALEATGSTSATLKIEIDGYNAGAVADGLTITSANNVIKGLVIRRFSGSGIRISSSGAMTNTVSGNYIGTDASGTADLGNGDDGVSFVSGPRNNTVGGTKAGERNIISGNDDDGIYIAGETRSIIVSGNYIGTDATGTADLGNDGDGVDIRNLVLNNTIGGTTSNERNVISGNDQYGVRISGMDTWRNTVSGNYIGTDVSGTADLGNGWGGVRICNSAYDNTIGGTTPGERNIISGNEMYGVYIAGETTGNIVCGNYIGTDASGTAALRNDWDGVYIWGDAHNNTVGPGNVIAHNGWDGVGVNGSSVTGNIITQNSIFSNTLGINLTGGANGGIAAPVIFTTTLGSVNVVGTACAGCTVELFENSDTDGEGETYVGDTTADAGGAFTVTVSSLSDPYLTATATDEVSGTSEFSEVFTATVTGGGSVYLPIILKNAP